MVLVDTSVWIDHFRSTNGRLVTLLDQTEVTAHPFVIGELACGNLKNRAEILSLLETLSPLPVIEPDQILFFIERNRLMGKGLGLIDVHLLASARVTHTPLWTRDKSLDSAAKKLGLSFIP